MKAAHTWMVSVVMLVLVVAVAVWIYPQLPAQVPTHWDLAGHPDGWSPRFWGVALWPLLMAALALLAWLLPVVSPQQFRMTAFLGVYRGLMLVVQAFVLVVGVCVMLAGAGHAVPIPLVTALAVGALFIVLGNYMGKLRKNFFIGIRSPWTLASDAVWERTHRLAGWLFVLAGVAWMVLALTGAARHVWTLVALIVVVAVVPYGYSYVVYRRLGPRDGQDEGAP